MRLRPSTVCFLALIFVPGALAVVPPARLIGQARLQELIEQLGDRSPRERDSAERELRTAGARILPALRKALGHKDAEIRRRAMRIIPALEYDHLFDSKRVTFSVKNKRLADVLAELSKASGYKVADGGQGFGGLMFNPFLGGIGRGPIGMPPAKGKEPTFTFDFDNEPFWDAIDRLCRDANLSVGANWGNDEFIRLYKVNGATPFAGRDGPFRYAAQNFQLFRAVDLTSTDREGRPEQNRSESLTFSFAIFAEPRFPILSTNPPHIDAAYDNERNTMVDANDDPNAMFGPFGFGGRVFFGGNNGKQIAVQATVNLARPSAKATSLKLLKGAIPINVLVKQEPIVLTDKFLASKGAKKKAGDIEFAIEEVKNLKNNQYQVKFTASGQNLDYNWTNSLSNRLELHDAKGNKIQGYSNGWSGGGNKMTVTMTYNNFRNAGEPVKLIYHLWESKVYDLRFEFRDLPLP